MSSRQCLNVVLATLAVVALGGWWASEATAQATGTVTGQVRNASTGQPLEAVQVYVSGTQIGGLTNAAGRYVLLNVPAGERAIQADLVGYRRVSQTVQVSAGQSVQADFQLTETAIELEQIVVTGAGAATERRKLGNTIATIDSRVLESAPVRSFSEVLQGRQAGVMVMPEGGLTGEGARIRIRGSASVSQANEPIVYIDGARVDNSGGYHSPFLGTGGGGTPSRLDDIPPEAIERVEILKGAAAATLYGTEASAGVIQIFTKRGRSGTPRWEIRSEFGLSEYPMDRAYEPLASWVRSDTAAARLSAYYERPIRPYEVFVVPEFYHDLVETGHSVQNSLSVTGGGEAVTYFVSGAYAYDDGPLGWEDLGPARDIDRRAHATANLQFFPAERLRIGISTNYTDRHGQVPRNNNNLYGPLGLINDANPREATCGTSPKIRIGRCDGPGNPFASTFFATSREAMQIQITQDVRHFTGTLNTNYQLARGEASRLAIDATAGVDVTSEFNAELLPYRWNVDGYTRFQIDGRRDISNREQRQLTVDFRANWDRQLGSAWSSSLVVGGQAFVTNEVIHASFGNAFPGPGLAVVGSAAAQGVFEQVIEQVSAGAFVQEQVGYQDYLFATVGGRFDRHSAFGEDAPSTFYPKLSFSLVPSQRDSWRSSLFSTVRVRGAIGQSGLQPGAFDKFTTFVPLNSEDGAGLQPGNLGNPDLKPEVSTEWELGGEVGILNDRAAVDVTYWHRTVGDALVPRQFPVSGGFSATQLVNIGQLSAQGVDISVRALALGRPNFSLNLFANGAYLHQRVDDLGGAPPLKVGGSYQRYRNFIREGHPPGAYFGPKLLPVGPGQVPFDSNGDGKADTREDFLRYLSQPRSLDAAGLSPLRVDEDGDRDFLDHYLGKHIPNWQGAFGFDGSFLRNFQFTTLFEYETGAFSTHNLTYAFREEGSWSRNTPKAARVEATMNNPASTAEQRLEAAMIWASDIKALGLHEGMNSIVRADFVRWREVSLTYTLPAETVARFGLNSLAFTVSGRNLALWSGYDGVDPEANNNGRGAVPSAVGIGGLDNNFLLGTDMYGFPLQRRITFSVRAAF
ncbi:MAG: SusC/RagA family TonB-linked outer membrane protein [Gemmatimonadetes bacterium]|nr:SusC/RagA family TonB-linked outer membrane protein [Gemmatimonadota bacterium]